MTTVRSAPVVLVPSDIEGGGPGERLRRLRRRRRLLREELAAVAVLLIALTATLVVLGLQWLGSGPSVTQGAVSLPAYYTIGGST